MNIETEICGELSRVFQTLLPGLEVEGNWLVDDDFLKGVESGKTEKMEISVSPRKYDGYTSRVAEFAVTIDTTFSLADDADLIRTVEAYELIVGKLEQWHADISAVKSDLYFNNEIEHIGFDPVGFKIDGGNFDIDRETKTRHLTQQFTIKGRITS